MIDNRKVGQRIAMLRRARGITQERPPEMLDVTGQAVSKWENGNALPDIGLLPALGRVLGTSLDQLLNPYDLFALEARYGAYEAWSDDLDDDARFDGLDDATFRRMMSVNHFCYQAVVDARRSGSAYLASCRGALEGGAATQLGAAAGLVAQVVQELAGGWQQVPNEEGCQGDRRQWWVPAMCRSQAALLREVAALEHQVEGAFRATIAAAGQTVSIFPIRVLRGRQVPLRAPVVCNQRSSIRRRQRASYITPSYVRPEKMRYIVRPSSEIHFAGRR